MSIDEQLAAVSRGAAEVFPDDDLRAKLALGRPLRIKLGLDPTAEHVTLGWAVVLRKLRAFQDLGHTAVLILGDFTARIGDPSGLNKTRPMLEREQVEAFAERVLGQFRLVLREDNLEVRRNSEWLEGMGVADFLRLCSHATVAQLLQRDDFANRFAEHAPISLMEMCYPLLQGYDSVAVRADVEIGGTDQHFNLIAGRELQRAFGQDPQAIVTMPLIEGTDGVQKMSQSKGNYIAVTEEPSEMFGKLMRIPDELMRKYLVLCTDLDDAAITGTLEAPPADAKRALAESVVRLYHGADAARAARERFDLVHREHGVPDDLEPVALPQEALQNGEVFVPALLKALGLAPSTAQARRLLEQGGVRVDGEPVTAERVAPEALRGRVIQVGRRSFARIASR